MKERLFKVVGKNKKLIKLIERFFEKEKIEQKLRNIMFESMCYGIEYEETRAYKIMTKKYKLEK